MTAPSCPHCKTGTLKRSGKSHTDTAGVKVREYACSGCGYTEAHPDASKETK